MQAGSNGPAFLFYEMQIPECVAKCFRQRVHVDVLIQEFDPELLFAAEGRGKPGGEVDCQPLMYILGIFVIENRIPECFSGIVIDDQAFRTPDHHDQSMATS